MKNRNFADISNNNQQPLDFKAYVQSGHVLLGHKTTEGLGFVDQFHVERTERAHKRGSWVLHYHFGHVGESPQEQAKFFWANCHGHFAPKDFLCIDTERGQANNGYPVGSVARWTNEFAQHLKGISGHSVIMYSNEALLAELVRAGLRIPGNRGWIAAYGPRKPSIGGISTWAWQYTDGVIGPQPHHYAGIGNCDGSLLNRGTFLRLALSKPRV